LAERRNLEFCNLEYGICNYERSEDKWNWHAHKNLSKDPAILFSLNDRPAIEALGFFREETRD